MKEETAKILRCPQKLSNPHCTEHNNVLCDGSACLAWIQNKKDETQGDCGMLAQPRGK
ncbi:hypothetical protein ACFLQK_00490 [bacterium]